MASLIEQAKQNYKKLTNALVSSHKKVFQPWTPEFQAGAAQFSKQTRSLPQPIQQALEGARTVPGINLIYKNTLADAPTTTAGKIARVGGAVAANAPIGFVNGVRSGLTNMGLSAGLGAGFGAYAGADPFVSASKGIGAGSMTGMIGKVTNPLIARAGFNAASKFTSSAAQQVANRGVQGLLSIPEGMIMTKSLGLKDYGLADAGIDAALGFVSGGASSGGAKAMANTFKARNDALKSHISTLEQKLRQLEQGGAGKVAIKQTVKAIDKAYKEIAQNRVKAQKLGLSAGIVDASDGSKPRISPQDTQQASLQGKGITRPIQSIDDQITTNRLKGGGTVDTRPLKVSSTKTISQPQVEEIRKTVRAVDKKVNAIDYLRTPDRVLTKIGLKKEADLLKQKYNDYLDELPVEINRVTGWYDRVKTDPTASQRIFKYLDGQNVKLRPNELKVAGEMKTYLKGWADRLGLPEDKRIANYITHIFEDDFIQKEFDPDLAKLITERVPGSVYDPFLEKRLGAQGYVEDAFQALDAYVKRGVRKFHMDQALGPLKEGAKKLDLESYKYVSRLGERINMRPTEIDSLLDTMVKQSPIGYKLGARPVARVSRGLRQAVYRGTLGLNFGSAIRNLTQGVNTYAKLGEKYTGIGYMKALQALATRSDELSKAGVLRDTLIQDRNISATKKFWENFDKGLFTFFEAAEKINRGAAYYGAKSRALARGLPEQQAIKEAVELARQTQFTFGSVDTPVAMQGDLAKLLGQFQSFNLKQTEFLQEMVKNKEYAAISRWLGANAVVLFTVGQAMGWDWKDFVPFGDVIGGERQFGQTPPVQLAGDLGRLATGGKDKYGQPIGLGTIGNDLIPFVPAGVQVKKTIQGTGNYLKGYSESKAGRVRFPVEKTGGNLLRSSLLGPNSVPEAREYYNKDRTPLGENQSKEFKKHGRKYYDYVMKKRESK